MVSCSVLGCRNRHERAMSGISFHRFPINCQAIKKWILACGRENWTPSPSARICSAHFEDQFYINSSNQLKPNTYPTKSIHNRSSGLKKRKGETEDLEKTPRKRRLRRIVERKPRLKKLRAVRQSKNDLSDSSLISDTEETSGAPGPSGPDVGLRSLSVDFLCKTCSKNITSFRYRCLVCPNYDMCGECERRGGHHDDHYVLRVPMQRPTVEVDRVESAARRALSSSTTWSKAFKSTAKSGDGKRKQSTKIENKPDKTRNSGDSRTDTGNDSENTEDALSDIERKPEITLHELGTTEPDVESSVDEPVVKVEFFIKEEVDPLDEEAAASAFLQNVHEHQTTQRSKDVPPGCPIPASQCVPPSHIILPTTQGVQPSQSVPPSKRRRADEHRFTTTTHSYKTTTNEPTGLCTETSSSLTAATSSESGSKVDVFVLKKRTRPADENYD